MFSHDDINLHLISSVKCPSFYRTGIKSSTIRMNVKTKRDVLLLCVFCFFCFVSSAQTHTFTKCNPFNWTFYYYAYNAKSKHW